MDFLKKILTLDFLMPDFLKGFRTMIVAGLTFVAGLLMFFVQGLEPLCEAGFKFACTENATWFSAFLMIQGYIMGALRFLTNSEIGVNPDNMDFVPEKKIQ